MRLDHLVAGSTVLQRVSRADSASPPLDYADSLRPSLLCIIIQSALASVLIPLLFLLLFGAPKKLHRKPIFYLNLAAICLGLAGGVLSNLLQLDAILYPHGSQDNRILLADAVLLTCIPIFIQFILFCRLWTVYSPTWTSWYIRAAIYAPVLLLLIARIVNIALTLGTIAHTILNESSLLDASEKAWKVLGTRIELVLQIVDNSYISILFLCKVKGTQLRADGYGHMAYARRLQRLFWNAATNFVFPVVLNVVQLMFILFSSDYRIETYMTVLFFVNSIVQILCAVSATLWATVYSRLSESTDSIDPLVTIRRISAVGRRPLPPDVGRSEEEAASDVIDIRASYV